MVKTLRNWFVLALGPALLASLAHADEGARSPESAETGETTAKPADEPSPEQAVGRTLTTTAEDVPPTFRFFDDEAHQSFVKPVIQMASSLVFYRPDSEVNPELSDRVSTLLLARFGLEGQLFKYVTFRSVFERNMGFSLARNGPVGTSVWEGTASLQARENYIRLSRWGLALTGGIFPDPSSVDHISVNVLDAFGMDPYVRDPLLVSGFNQGQGIMLRYDIAGLSAGVSYSAGNPLTSSLAFGFGGNVSALGTLFTAPLRALSNGIPGSDIHMHVVTPSVMYTHELFGVKAAAQIYRVDVDVTTEEDKALFGYNLRTTAEVKPMGQMLRFFLSGALRRNDQLAVPDLTIKLNDDYEGVYVSGGADFAYEGFGIGGGYTWLTGRPAAMNKTTHQYLNLGATYWIYPGHVSASLRYARSMADSEGSTVQTPDTQSVILGMRLLL